MISELERTKLKIGFKEVLKAVEANRTQKVFVAEDCEDRIKNSLADAANKAGVSVEYAETMRELGKACGIDVGTSCAAVIKF